MQLVKVFIGNRIRNFYEASCESCGVTVQRDKYRVKKNPRFLCQSCNCRSAVHFRWKNHEVKTNTPIHNSWSHMMRRCYERSNKKYHRYGGRGISVCKEWHNFETFKAWAINDWFPKATLDRIDNDGNYCPENCQWLTASENSKKRWRCS